MCFFYPGIVTQPTTPLGSHVLMFGNCIDVEILFLISDPNFLCHNVRPFSSHSVIMGRKILCKNDTIQAVKIHVPVSAQYFSQGS